MSKQQATDWVIRLCIVLLTGGVTWAASAIMDHDTRIAVEESTTVGIAEDLKEIKADIKELLRH